MIYLKQQRTGENWTSSNYLILTKNKNKPILFPCPFPLLGDGSTNAEEMHGPPKRKEIEFPMGRKYSRNIPGALTTTKGKTEKGQFPS